MEPELIFHAMATHPPLKVIDFLDDNTEIFVGGQSGILTFIRFAPRYNSSQIKVSNTTIICIKYDKTSKIIVVGDKNGYIYLISPDHKSILKSTKQHQQQINDIALSPDGNMLVTASNDRAVKFFTFPELKLITSNQGHKSWVTSVVYTSNGKKIITAASDRKVRIWGAKTHKLYQIFEDLPSVPTYILQHPEKVMYFIGFINGQVGLYDNTTKLVKLWAPHKSVVTSLNYDPHSNTLLSSSDDSTLCVIDCKANKMVMTLEAHHSHVAKVSWCNDGKHFASCDSSGRILVWEMPNSINSDIPSDESESVDNNVKIENHDISTKEISSEEVKTDEIVDEIPDNHENIEESEKENTIEISEISKPEQEEPQISNDKEESEHDEALESNHEYEIHEEIIKQTEDEASALSSGPEDKPAEETHEEQKETDIETPKPGTEEKVEEEYKLSSTKGDELNYPQAVEDENSQNEEEDKTITKEVEQNYPQAIEDENSQNEEEEDKSNSTKEETNYPQAVETEEEANEIIEEEEEKHESTHQENFGESIPSEIPVKTTVHLDENNTIQLEHNEDEAIDEDEYGRDLNALKERVHRIIAELDNDEESYDEEEDLEKLVHKYLEEEDNEPTKLSVDQEDIIPKDNGEKQNTENIEEENNNHENEINDKIEGKENDDNNETKEEEQRNENDDQNHEEKEQTEENEPKQEEENENDEENNDTEEEDQKVIEHDEEESKIDDDEEEEVKEISDARVQELRNILDTVRKQKQNQNKCEEEETKSENSMENIQIEDIKDRGITLSDKTPDEEEEEEEDLVEPIIIQEDAPRGCNVPKERIENILLQISSQLEILQHTSEGMIRRAEDIQTSINELSARNCH